MKKKISPRPTATWLVRIKMKTLMKINMTNRQVSSTKRMGKYLLKDMMTRKSEHNKLLLMLTSSKSRV